VKVLWFSNNSTLYDQSENFYHGCGWIDSLQILLQKETGIELAIAFFHSEDKVKSVRDGVTYYPISKAGSRVNLLRKLINNWKGSIEVVNLKNDVKRILSDFDPDLVHVFGTEGAFSQIKTLTHIPVVYHFQGLINPILNTYLPINQSKYSFYLNFNYLLNNIKGNSPAFELKRFKNQAKRELSVLNSLNYVMGRTDWDKNILNIFNPDAVYFHINEVLRPVFYDDFSVKSNKMSATLRIVSTLSPTVYKGIDVVLKTAKVLMDLVDIDFQWEVIGLDANCQLVQHFEKIENIKHSDVNVVFCGKKPPAELVACLQSADIFIHPSYIDNSPNSVCEAQMIGLPVIACNVGGVSSIVEHGYSGILVPSNGVYEIIHYIKVLYSDLDLRDKIVKQAMFIAKKRHNRVDVVQNLLSAYEHIILTNVV
jgi:glycosyltransferase involved in cell wall biosynthesis